MDLEKVLYIWLLSTTDILLNGCAGTSDLRKEGKLSAVVQYCHVSAATHQTVRKIKNSSIYVALRLGMQGNTLCARLVLLKHRINL